MTAFVPAHLGPRYRLADLAPLTARQRVICGDILTQDRPSDWESLDCLCGASGGRILTEVDRYGLPYRKVLCAECGLMRVTPRWTAARYGRFYQEHYRDLYSPLAEVDGSQTLMQLARGPGATLVSRFVEDAWARFGSAYVARPTIVEIGAGGGWNLARLSDKWNKVGYDTDERFLQLGKATFGVDMRLGFLSDAISGLAEADCILLSHVLEHVPDPVASLRELTRAARPDALVLIEVPGIFRLHKTSLDPMRYWQNAHTFTFCAKTVVDTCRRAGLEPLAADEWIRLVLRPGQVARLPVRNDPALARSIDRYLRYCERSYQVAQECARVPALGARASALARRAADALVRAADAANLIHGTRVGAAAISPPV